jgi:hypothetical protein
VLEGGSFSSGDSKSATARRNQTRLVSGVSGQMNSAIDSRQRHRGAALSGILVSTAL